MPTIIRCGGGIPVSDYESLQSDYESLQNDYNSYKSSHSHTNDEYTSYGAQQYNAGIAAEAGKTINKTLLYEKRFDNSTVTYTTTKDYKVVVVFGGVHAATNYAQHMGIYVNNELQKPNQKTIWMSDSSVTGFSPNSSTNLAILTNVKTGTAIKMQCYYNAHVWIWGIGD